MNEIKVALLSFGMSGRVFHAPLIAALPGYRLHAVLERTPRGASEAYPGIRIYRDLDTLLGDAEIDLVVVNTPNDTHYEYTRRALEAGRHVVTEKPFTVTAAEAESLIRLAAERGRMLTVYHNRRWDSGFLLARSVVESGKLGRLVEAEFYFDRYKRELNVKQHKEVPSAGNGSLYDLGSHLIDGVVQLFGPPEGVWAELRTVRPVGEVTDYFDLHLRYPGLSVRVKGSYLVRAVGPAYILHGEGGSFKKVQADVQEAKLIAGEKPGGDPWGREPQGAEGVLTLQTEAGVTEERLPAPPGAYTEFYRQLHRALTAGGPPPVRAEDALLVIRIIEAAIRSGEEGRFIPLPA